jgi:two-component system response regulator FixJ
MQRVMFSPTAESGVTHASATILIVSADPVERARLAALASAAGHRVVEFASGQELLSNVAPPARTAIVLDRGADGDDIFGLLGALHERGLYLPTLVAVPQHAIDAAVDAMRRGASDVLERPIGPAHFLRSLDAVLDAPRAVWAVSSENPFTAG